MHSIKARLYLAIKSVPGGGFCLRCYGVTKAVARKIFGLHDPSRDELDRLYYLNEPTNWRISGAITTENEVHDRGEPYSISIPNIKLRQASSIGDLGYWYAIGEAWAQIAFAFLPPSPRVLDIGCGCGKMARFFILVPNLLYVGLDIFYPSIYWCEREFKRFSDRFAFRHLDVASPLYNPSGVIAGDQIQLPVESGSVDLAICGSLFTHLLEPTFLHYLSELQRCLSPTGKAVISLHTEPSDGRFSGNEEQIDVSKEYFQEMALSVGLEVFKEIGNVYGQQVYVLAHTVRA